ncbi:alpha-N-arabinofuranosidase [Aquabacterium sp. OR-4]|uniref:alpha-N-arabinofuranosidase n=1 Tax=Aquabacterium sp. OR-4 TaxID=2978127 RepID=UPI0028C6612E|nr:alpha-L-arabinofuranosidase C-terminal domain-containing protein [Aquabacterium sp. OR-4]MDT7838890.1 alpha-L-arabinofuranosidase C-terminal domain-containing protein [Aquabacterium sp. OR-4]
MSLLRLPLVLAFLVFSGPLLAATPPVQLNIQPDPPGPTIARQIYGQFAEHLGSGVYGGLWVGPDSPIANTRGWRNDVLAALKDLKVPVLRWPGGCFADEYHWRDGIGPRDKRPVRINTSWGGVPEPNAVGTHEFFDLAEMLGAETYVNANLGTGTPQEMAEWLEYLTSDGPGSLAQARRANGRDKPWRVHHWGIGNEAWGCGGHMRPEYYADLYRHWSTFAKAPRGNRPKLVASGGQNDELNWTEVLSRDVKQRIDAISHHRYSLPTGDWKIKGSAIGFAEREWLSTLAVVPRIDANLAQQRALLDRHDPARKIALYFDEWGSWYDPEPGTDPGFLVQRNTLRDAVLAALHFHVFHAHAERVKMANVAQMVNVLQAMVITSGPRMVLTPTYHAFRMHLPFQDATALTLQLQAVPRYALGDLAMPQLSASAARGADGKLYLSLVNVHPREPLALALSLGGVVPTAVRGQLLTAAAMDAENTLDAPERLRPQAFEARARNGRLPLELPAKSVLVLEVLP